MATAETTATPPQHTIERGPATAGERSAAPDIARGFMLLLIALGHASLYTTSRNVIMNHPMGGSALDRTVTFFGMIIMDNRSYPMFSALFGFGMAMMVSRQLAAGTTPRDASRLLRRRGVILLIFGFIHMVFIFPSDILGPYGVVSLAFGWLMVRSDRALRRGVIATGIFVLISTTTFSVLLALTENTYGNTFRGTLWARDYGSAVLTRMHEVPLADIHVLLEWPIVTAMLVGALAARRGYLSDPAQHRVLLRRVAMTFIPISVLGAIPLALDGAEVWHAGDLAVGLTTALHTVTGFFGGLGYVAVFGLIAARSQERQRQPGRIQWALAAVGRRSLTCYLLQTSLFTLLLSRVALDLGDKINATGAAGFAILVWLTAVATASTLEHFGKRGPIDALMRRLVYARRSPRREAEAVGT
jgi:uncharacterized protein